MVKNEFNPFLVLFVQICIRRDPKSAPTASLE